MSESKKTVSPEVSELTDKLMNDLTVAANGITDVKPDLFIRTLPENLDEKTVRAVNKHTTNFIAASANAVGKLAVAAMAGDKKMSTVTAHIPTVGHDYVDIAVHREKTFVNPQDKDHPITKQGAVDIKYHVQAGAPKAGQLKTIRALLAEEAAKALKK